MRNFMALGSTAVSMTLKKMTNAMPVPPMPSPSKARIAVQEGTGMDKGCSKISETGIKTRLAMMS